MAAPDLLNVPTQYWIGVIMSIGAASSSIAFLKKSMDSVKKDVAKLKEDTVSKQDIGDKIKAAIEPLEVTDKMLMNMVHEIMAETKDTTRSTNDLAVSIARLEGSLNGRKSKD